MLDYFRFDRSIILRLRQLFSPRSSLQPIATYLHLMVKVLNYSSFVPFLQMIYDFLLTHSFDRRLTISYALS